MTAPRQPEIELPPAPPPAPRAITPAAARRSLLEPRVRFWWLATLVFGCVTLFLVGKHTLEWFEELNVVRHGAPVTATIAVIGEGEQQDRFANPDNLVTMEFDYNGAHYSVSGYLEGRTETVSLKQAVPIKVDPSDPTIWTYRTDTPPLGRALLSPALVLPFTIASAAASLILRRRFLRTWTTGLANPFVVEEIGQSALAPSSWVVRCRIMDGRTQRLASVFMPRRLMTPKKGDVLWLIHAPQNPTAAIAAAAYG